MILGFEQRHSLGFVLRPLGGQDAPDTSGQQAAALMEADLSKEQLAWAKEIYAQTAPDRAAAADRANAISDAQLDATKQQTAIAADAYGDYKSNYQPLEQSIVAEAQGYDTPERRAAEAAKASADVQAQVDAQRGATMREQERSGVNPASGKILALQGSMDLGAAKLKAGAANTAVRQIETVGAAKKADAANLGRGIASSQATNASLALQQGNSSASNALGALTPQAQAAQQLSAGYSGAQAGLAGSAATYGSIAQTQAQANAGSSGIFGALGNVAGAFAGSKAGSAAIASLPMFSDKNMKEDIEPASDEKSLEAITRTPVATWKYRDDSPAADGGKQHIGPMAQDLQANAGDDVAPGGKMIDPVSANGLVMSAIRGLDKKVESLAEQFGSTMKRRTAA